MLFSARWSPFSASTPHNRGLRPAPFRSGSSPHPTWRHPVERSQRHVRVRRLPVVAGSVAGGFSEVAACCGAGCGGGSRFCAWRFQSPASACLDACCTTHVNSVFLHPGRWGCPLLFAGGCLPFPSPVGRLKSPALCRECAGSAAGRVNARWPPAAQPFLCPPKTGGYRPPCEGKRGHRGC